MSEPTYVIRADDPFALALLRLLKVWHAAKLNEEEARAIEIKIAEFKAWKRGVR